MKKSKNIDIKKKKLFYEDNGYVIIENFFSPDECNDIQKNIRRHTDKTFGAILNPDRYEFLERQDPREKTESVQREIKETSGLIRSIMKNQKAVKILEEFQEREIVGLMSQIIFKESGSQYALQAWNPHQDNHYIQNKNGQYVTTNIFLESADIENGTLYIYPGSHKLGLLPADSQISYRESNKANPGNIVQIPADYQDKKIDLFFDKGDLLVLNGNTIHGSYPNISKTRSRPLLSISYIAKGEYFIPGNNAKRQEILLH